MTRCSVAASQLLAIITLWAFLTAQGQRVQHGTQPPRAFNTNMTFSKSMRTEALDVEKLNRLISAIDKTWMLPRPGSRDPVGSNFQYKKTCASIYKARYEACHQVGFGVMCFNYCFEQGEQLQFPCQDQSDSSLCRSSSFDSFLMKHRNDAYKAKSYILQMISRCYATAICNPQHGILNTSIIDGSSESSRIDELPLTATTSRNATPTNSRVPMRMRRPAIENRQESRQRWLKIQPTRPLPIWQRLLPTEGITTTPKSFPIVAETGENKLAEVESEETEENSGTVETTDTNPEETGDETSPEHAETTAPTEIEQTSTENSPQTSERPWWWLAALRQLEKNTERLIHQ